MQTNSNKKIMDYNIEITCNDYLIAFRKIKLTREQLTQIENIIFEFNSRNIEIEKTTTKSTILCS